MPANFLETLDGTGREPFPLQVEFLTWLQQQKTRIIAGQLPTGVGKLFAILTIMRATKGWGVASSNMLLDQASCTYPDVNILKGAAHYDCKARDTTCGQVRELGFKPCQECPYRQARRDALAQEITMFNPISLHALSKDSGFTRPKVTVIDEAQTLINMLLLVSGERFRSSKYKLPKSTDALDVLAWLEAQEAKITRLVTYFNDKKETHRASQALADLTKITTVKEGLAEDPQNYSIHISTVPFRGKLEQVLHVLPLDPPRGLVESVVGTGRVILLSATLSRLNVERLFPGEKYSYIDMASPIPLEQRPVKYVPLKVKANSQTSPKVVVEYVRDILKAHPGENTIVHTTYGMSRLLKPYAGLLPGKVWFNTAENKNETIAKFKAEGGIFFAAGCAEGLDLPDDECRVNIVPILNRQNPSSPDVRKWLARPGGRKRYEMEILETLQQQLGRGVRHINDRCTMYVGDGGLPDLTNRNRADISDSFYNAIQWGKK